MTALQVLQFDGIQDLFNRCYGAAPEHVALAGGCVNLIGEHASITRTCVAPNGV